jgi:hypothetical protein
MALPTISIPEIPLPSSITDFISTYLGAYLVHFIVAIPVIVLLLELYNLGTKRRSTSLFSLFLLIVLAILIIAFYLNGSAELITVYLVYASLALLVFKLLFMALRKTIGRVIFALMVAGFTFVTLMQVNEGGVFAKKEVVVTAPVEAPIVDTKVEDELTAKLKELQSKYDALVEESKKVVVAPVPTPTPTSTIEVVEKPIKDANTSESNSSN